MHQTVSQTIHSPNNTATFPPSGRRVGLRLRERGRSSRTAESRFRPRARLCSAWSAASIAHVEARFDDDALKNRLCSPLALPNSCEDWLPMTLGELSVQKQWAEDPALRQWVSEHRLTGSNLLSKRTDRPLDPEGKAIRDRLSLATPRAIASLERLCHYAISTQMAASAVPLLQTCRSGFGQFAPMAVVHWNGASSPKRTVHSST
jgi:hypothetical protein